MYKLNIIKITSSVIISLPSFKIGEYINMCSIRRSFIFWLVISQVNNVILLHDIFKKIAPLYYSFFLKCITIYEQGVQYGVYIQWNKDVDATFSTSSSGSIVVAAKTADIERRKMVRRILRVFSNLGGMATFLSIMLCFM